MTLFKNSERKNLAGVWGGIDLIVKPPLRRAAIEAVTVIGAGAYEAVFINLPRCLQQYVSKLAETGDVEGFIEEARTGSGLSESYLTALVRGHESFLRLLPRVSGGREIICYSPSPTDEEIRAALELPSLILRDSVTMKVSLERWLSLIEEMVESAKSKLEEEVDFLIGEAGRFRSSACICDPGAAVSLMKLLQKRAPTRILYTGLPYRFTPLQTLLRLYRHKPPPAGEVEKHIKQHLRFVQKYVVPLGLEDGLEAWTEKELKWLRGRPDKPPAHPPTPSET